MLTAIRPEALTLAGSDPAPDSTEAVEYAVAVYTGALPTDPAEWPGPASGKVTLCDVTKTTSGSLTPTSLARDSRAEPLYYGAYGPLRASETVKLDPVPRYTVTVQKAGTGSGTVVPDGGTYKKGKGASFAATAGKNSTFARWDNCDSVDNDTDTCYVDAISADRTVTVTFTKSQCSAAATVAAGAGTVTVGAVGETASASSWSGDCGTTVRFTATASSGYCYNYRTPAPLLQSAGADAASCVTTPVSWTVETAASSPATAYLVYFRSKSDPPPVVQCPDGTTVPNGQTCPVVQCPDGTTVPNGQTCPVVQCPDGTSVPNGQTCPPPVVTNIWSVTTTNWYATVTCTNGSSFVLGPYGSSGAAASAAEFALITCSSSFSATLAAAEEQGIVTHAWLEASLEAELAATGSPFGLEELAPASARGAPTTETEASAATGPRFSTAVAEDGQQYASVTCDEDTAFTVGPAASVEAVVKAGLLGLEVCADADALARLALPESGVVTVEALQGALPGYASHPGPSPAPTPTPVAQTQEAQGEGEQQQVGDYYTVWPATSTTWSWSASCGTRSGSGSGYGDAAAAGVAVLDWVARNCN